MKKPPKIKLSIVIVNFNTRDLLEACLGSIPKNNGYQVIVVDNASTDGSGAMVRKDFPEVTLLASRTNDGYTKNNNKARKMAVGEYVLFLNSDTEVYQKTLETMVGFMDSDEAIGVATCLVLLPDGKLYYACHRGFPTLWDSLGYFLGLPSNYNGSFWPIDKIHEIDACSGTFLLIRKNILDKIGWFDEDYYSYGEDIEMCYRVKELGFKVMFNPTVKIMHYWRASVAKSDDKNKAIWDTARYGAMKIFYDKHYRHKYPKLVRQIVFLAIDLASLWRG